MSLADQIRANQDRSGYSSNRGLLGGLKNFFNEAGTFLKNPGKYAGEQVSDGVEAYFKRLFSSEKLWLGAGALLIGFLAALFVIKKVM